MPQQIFFKYHLILLVSFLHCIIDKTLDNVGNKSDEIIAELYLTLYVMI